MFEILGTFYLHASYKNIKSHLPQWFQDGVAGEVSFEAEITLNTFHADYSACSNGNSADVQQIAILKQIQEQKYDRDTYLFFPELELKNKDSYVNLRKSPNGKILARIEPKNAEKYSIFWLEDFEENGIPQWLKVLYFPPDKNKAKDAIVGYISKSQFVEDSISLIAIKQVCLQIQSCSLS